MVGNNIILKQETVTPKRGIEIKNKDMSDKRKVELKPTKPQPQGSQEKQKVPFKRRSGTEPPPSGALSVGSSASSAPSLTASSGDSTMHSRSAFSIGSTGNSTKLKGELKEGHDDTGNENDNNCAPAGEKKFTSRCRLFVGNLPSDASESDFKKMFEPFGKFTEIYLHTSRGFGFIRMDTRQNAEAAKAVLDGSMMKGRMLRVRFATHSSALKVKYLSPFVSNELLEQAFSMFGEIERAIVICDDRGRPTGEGIVEFARKPGALSALRRINEGVFLLTASPRPVMVEPLEQRDDVDGLPDKFMPKNPDMAKEREQAPRFVNPGSFEYECGQKWKDAYTLYTEQLANLKRDLEDNENKLEMDMANAQLEHTAAMLRQDLMRRQEELRLLEEQQTIELQRRLEHRRHDDDRRRLEQEKRRKELDMRRQQMDDRRQQELYAQQERAMREMHGDVRSERGGGAGNAPPMQPPPAPPVGLGLERGNSRQNLLQSGMGNLGGMGLAGNNPEGAGVMLSAGGHNMQNPQMRQSRFDQPPNFQAGPGGPNMGAWAMGSNMGANMMQGANVMGSMGPGGNLGKGGNMGPGGNMGLGGNMGPGQNKRAAGSGGNMDRGGNNNMGGNGNPMGVVSVKGAVGGGRNTGPIPNLIGLTGSPSGSTNRGNSSMDQRQGGHGGGAGGSGSGERPQRDEFFENKRPRRF